ncbi:unnamed protein product [Phyllotreta striolata]|uniref:Uncharacterized protein n=1 Tax=Phyllotreta striolata TaxID=444603 RepID=A0A9N9XIT4_PHYSR|nr:unnamed protein product [Phyllotreta striolata]
MAIFKRKKRLFSALWPDASRGKSETYKMYFNYGHDCTLEDLKDNYDWDYAPEWSVCGKLKRWWARMRVVSDTSKFYTHHLRSYGAISAERKRHLQNYPNVFHPFSLGR